MRMAELGFRGCWLLLALAFGLAGPSPSRAGDGVVRVVCLVDGAEYAKGEIRVGGKVKGDCPRSDIFLPAGEHAISVEHVIGDGSLFRGTETKTIREDSATRIEVVLAKVFTEEFYYNKQDWSGLLKAYPGGKYAADANLRIEDDLYAKKDWSGIVRSYPNGRYADEAVYRSMLPREYIDKFPNGKFSEIARQEFGRYSGGNPDAGRVFRDCQTCPEMVVIPAGSFMMGEDDKSNISYTKPQHLVRLNYSFAVSRFPITNGEWSSIVSGADYKHDDPSARYPVTGVNWNDAQKFVRSINAKTGKRYRLLSEAEWEYSARAGSATIHSWGNEIGNNNANCLHCGSQWDGKGKSPVGSFRPNRFGLYDMEGNVLEWVADCWSDDYIGAPRDGSVWGTSDRCYVVLRGIGSGNYNSGVASRMRFDPLVRVPEIGFRVARDLP
ncbi:formylglycine-generating enzyme family protein [Magnetospirillum sp. ME-1]|uniref:formylglycine-generating enzyme family protein n=1 Tax=Magnetospirillum sp. ME-1 TaxID=1639348 RepID=UPI000A18E86C|nr:formylglycine-generating enzyme family protein [Magnetospirillum sp. ME-1]